MGAVLPPMSRSKAGERGRSAVIKNGGNRGKAAAG